MLVRQVVLDLAGNLCNALEGFRLGDGYGKLAVANLYLVQVVRLFVLMG